MKLNTKSLEKNIRDREKRMENEKNRRDRASMNYASMVVGDNYLKVLGPHENMDGIPWVHRRMHWQLGPEGKGNATCLRDDEESPVENCEACKESYDLFKAGSKDKASAIRVKPREVIQVVNLTSYVKKVGTDKPLPECLFLERDETSSKCKKCKAADVCMSQIQPMTLPVSVSDELLGDFDDLIKQKKFKTLEKAFNTSSGVVYRIKRKGTGKEDTNYSGVKRFATAMIFSDKTTEWIDSNLFDLSSLLKKMTSEDLRSLIDEGLVLSKEEGESDLPSCYGDDKKFNAKSKKCKKCEIAEACEEEVKEKDDEEEPDEDVEEEELDDDDEETTDDDDDEETTDDDDEDDEETTDDDDDDEDDDEETTDDDDDEDDDEETTDDDDEEDDKLDNLKKKLLKQNAAKKKAIGNKAAVKKAKKKIKK